MDRRAFLTTAAASLATSAMGRFASAAAEPTILRAHSRVLDVNGRAATVYGMTNASGGSGLSFAAGDRFNVALRNELSEETLIHWHGLTPPWEADGVPDRPAKAIKAGETRLYDFPVGPAGTHWMHAHTLQEQNLLAAPLIVREARIMEEQEIVILLHDFSFTPATELLAGLTKDATAGAASHGAHGAASHAGHGGPATMDLNDIEYDAYLANDRTLADPEVIQVEGASRVRLRIINGATSTAFTIDIGALSGELIAVDGQPVALKKMRRVPLSMGQRADIVVAIPKEGGAFPVLALREGARERAGIILASSRATVARIPVQGEALGPVLGLAEEGTLQAQAPLSVKAPHRRFDMLLTGDMAGYRWGLETPVPMKVRRSERIEVRMNNRSMMAHPMHLHGHRFQVVEINGRRIAGAVRDTVLVPPSQSVTIAFDADNPGAWAFHCHHLYHMATGMMAELTYEGSA